MEILRQLEVEKKQLKLEMETANGNGNSMRSFTDDEIAVQLKQVREPENEFIFQVAFIEFCNSVLENPWRWARCLDTGDLLRLVDAVSFVPVQKNAMKVLDNLICVMTKLSAEEKMMTGIELLSRSSLGDKLVHLISNFPDIETLVLAINLATTCLSTTSDFRDHLVEIGVMSSIFSLKVDQDTAEVKAYFIRRAAKFSYEQEGLIELLLKFLVELLYTEEPALVIHALKGLESSTSRNFGALQLIQENTSILCRITECFKDETLVESAARLIHTLIQVTEISSSEFINYGTIQALVACLKKDDVDLVRVAVSALEQWLKTPERPVEAVLSCLQGGCDTISQAPYQVKFAILELFGTISTLDCQYISSFVTPDFVSSLCDYVMTGDPKLCLQAVNIMENFVCTLQPENPSIITQFLEILSSSGALEYLSDVAANPGEHDMSGKGELIEQFLKRIQHLT